MRWLFILNIKVKKLIIFILLLSVIIISIETIKYQQNKPCRDATTLEKEVIINYLENKYVHSTEDCKYFAECDIFGVSDLGNEQIAYLWALIEAYSFDKNNVNLNLLGSSSIPMAIFLKTENGKTVVYSYRIPGDGSKWVTDVKNIFPKEYYKIILKRNTNVEDFEKNIRKRAQDYFLSK